jgi:hypothetical protein
MPNYIDELDSGRLVTAMKLRWCDGYVQITAPPFARWQHHLDAHLRIRLDFAAHNK